MDKTMAADVTVQIERGSVAEEEIAKREIIIVWEWSKNKKEIPGERMKFWYPLPCASFASAIRLL